MTKAYACFNKDSKIQEKSSSGGVFFLLAREVLQKKGIVFGVQFDESWEAVHTVAEKLEDVYKMLGSKYIQSRIGDSYYQVQKYLKEGRQVLFSGTPCQIAGLYAYLGETYENLLTVGVICHGVSGNLIWRQYLQYISKGRKIRRINFRDKTSGWLDYKIKVEFKDGTVYSQSRGIDVFMRGFLKNLSLRPSCYQCPFKEERDMADITLGDYWGVRENGRIPYHPMGVSTVLVRTHKGKINLEKVQDYLNIEEVELESLYQTNPNLLQSVERPKERDIVYQRDKGEILPFINQMTRKTYIQTRKHQVKKGLRIVRNKILHKE